MNRLHVALVDRAAMQWSALGVTLQAPRERAVVDIEAPPSTRQRYATRFPAGFSRLAMDGGRFPYERLDVS